MAHKSIVVGTAGHIDHGKSALVRALTGTDPDRLKEEKARGITIDLGFAHQEIEGVNFAFVDVPGHERFVKNMLAGVGGIDVVVLVVAADESVMPQTREHFDLCRLLRVPAGFVALTKSDLVDHDTELGASCIGRLSQMRHRGPNRGHNENATMSRLPDQAAIPRPTPIPGVEISLDILFMICSDDTSHDTCPR